MKAESKDTPVTIGAEVEMPYPRTWPNAEVKAAWDAFCAKNRRSNAHGTPQDVMLYSTSNVEKSTTGEQISHQDRHWSIHPWEDCLPEAYRSPLGWERGWEAEHEFRFKGPASTLKEVFGRFDNLGAYFKAWGHVTIPSPTFGTHVHLGVRDWLKRIIPSTPTDGNWVHTPAARLLAAAITLRSKVYWSFLPQNRRAHNNGGVFHNVDNFGIGTPLAHIHTFYAQRPFIPQSALQGHRKGIPTMEMRIYAATAETRAIQGWVAFLVFLLKNFERQLTEDVNGFDNYVRPTNVSEASVYDDNTGAYLAPTKEVVGEPPTKGILVNPATYSLDHLKNEIRETGFWVAPLISWIDETLKRDGAPTPFEGSLHEIYDTDAAAKVKTTKASSGKRKSARFCASEPMLAAA